MDSADAWPQTEWPPLLAPIAQKMPGRPKLFKRRPQLCEISKQGGTQGSNKTSVKRESDKPVKLSKKGTLITCSVCKEQNHNARKCPRGPPNQKTARNAPGRRGKDIPVAQKIHHLYPLVREQALVVADQRKQPKQRPQNGRAIHMRTGQAMMNRKLATLLA